MSYYVYILRCDDGSYYTGHTKDIDHRVKQHRQGQGARYTRMHEPDEIVYVEAVGSRGEAMQREREIKSLNHSDKEQLARAQSGFDT